MEVQYDDANQWFIVKEKIDNQTFFMEFQLYFETNDTLYYNICMGIYNKRKHAARNEDEKRITGLNPLRTVVVAKKVFELLEQTVIEHNPTWRKHISCGWVDNRRRDAYYSFLSKRGYQYGRIGTCKCIYKLVDKNKN